jgi:hypothetical protein
MYWGLGIRITKRNELFILKNRLNYYLAGADLTEDAIANHAGFFLRSYLTLGIRLT